MLLTLTCMLRLGLILRLRLMLMLMLEGGAVGSAITTLGKKAREGRVW